MPEAGIGEKAGSALRVVDDRDFEKHAVGVPGAGQLLGEKGEVGEVVDDGLGDASPCVPDDGSLAELESEDDRGVDSVIEARDDEQLRSGQAECHRGIGARELLVALEQGGHPGHGGSVPFQGVGVMLAVAYWLVTAGIRTPLRSSQFAVWCLLPYRARAVFQTASRPRRFG